MFWYRLIKFRRYIIPETKIFYFLGILVLGVSLFPQPAWAYIDPGTSGFIFSVLGPIIAAVIGFLAIFFRPILTFFSKIYTKAKENPLIGVTIISAFILAASGLVWYVFISPSDGGNVYMENVTTKKVIYLGMDGLDPKIMERLMDAGELPNFSRLRQTGGYAHMQTSNPAQSPVAWSCMATGANPGKHGIFDFIKRNPKNYLPDLAILQFNKGLGLGEMFTPVRRGTAFWEITSQAGIPSTIIRWPITFPPKKTDATVFAGLGVPDIKGTLGHYAFYTNGVIDPNDKGKFKIIQVTANNGEINTEIIGPPVAGFKKDKKASIPMTIKLDIGRKQAQIKIGDQTLTLKEGSWSNWVHLNFSLGFLKKASGIAKFYLTEVNPVLKLYLSPIQVDPLDPVFSITNPKDYAAQLAEAIGVYHTLGMPEDTNALTEKRFDEEAFLQSCQEIMREREKMLLYELARFKGGVLAFVFDTTDRIQHMFWRFEEPELFNPPQELYQKHKDAVEDIYREADQILGTVLKYTDNDTYLIVSSDHGFSSFKRAVHLNSWLVENGYMTLNSAPGNRKDNSLFADVVWEKTKAYAIGFGSMYLNIKGREGKGIVSTAEVASLGREIADKLETLEDPATNTLAVNQVYLRDELFSGPYADQAPDLVVGFYPQYRASWQTAIGGAPNALFEDNLKPWSGDHCIDPQFVPGILFTNRKLKTDTPSLIDIAPTILDCLDMSIPEFMEGKSVL